MKVLIDIGHPAHVHLFKNFTKDFENKGHKVLFTTRQKEFEIELLQANSFAYKSFGKHYKSLIGKIFGIVKFDLQMLITSLKFKPDLFLSHGSMYAAHIAGLLRRSHISMEDCGNMEQVKLYRPFTQAILTPDVLPKELGKKQVRYKGYHELAYLHPHYFTPDENVKSWLGLQPDEKFCILRFVSWKATHDIGHKGFSSEEKIELVKELSKKLKVFISSEAKLPDELRAYQIKLPPHLIHHALAFAEIVISEGATIASEAGVLGTPAIYVNTISASNNEDQEKYELVFNYRSGNGVLEKSLEILTTGKELYKRNNAKLLSEKIDVTEFMIRFVEDYCESNKG